MFDEDCYQHGYSALDEEFKSGHYYVVSNPSMSGPNRVIRLQQGKNNVQKKRGGSSDNLLIVKDPHTSISNGYHGRRGERERSMEYDDQDWLDQRQMNNNYHKIRSLGNLHAPNLYSPKSDDLNRARRERESYEYYKRYDSPSYVDAHPRYRNAKEMSRYDSISSDERSVYLQPQNTKDYFRSMSNDTESSDDVLININRGMHPRSMQRIANNEHLARSWESRSPGGSRWGSQGRLGSNDAFINEKPYRKAFYSNNNNNSNNYRDGSMREIRVERTDSSGPSSLSTKDYWENKWSSGTGDNRRGFVKSASPSLSGDVGSRSMVEPRRNPYLSIDNLSSSPGRWSPGINTERSRLNSRVVYDGVKNNSQKPPKPSPKSSGNKPSRTEGSSNEKEFLSKVQQELEFQRKNLTGEIDKLLAPMGTEIEKSRSPLNSPGVSAGLSSSFNAEKNTFVDTSGLCPVFKAFVDVNEYPPSSVTVGLDQLGNKVIVEARQNENPKNHIATSFTQKIPLPRYADTTSMSAKLNRKGVLKIEVPLLFYFPSDHENKSSGNILGKSFVNEVKTNSRDGSKVMEIVVKPGAEVTLNDLRVEVSEDGQLTVYVERHATGQSGNKERKVIKTYSLPETAILDGISSKMANDGTLSISVPISGGRGSMR